MSRSELLKSFWDFGFDDMSESEMDQVLALVDTDNSGLIGFDEFLMTAVAPEDLLTNEAMRQAFIIFDEDGGNSISVEEIMGELNDRGWHIPIATWKLVFQMDPNKELDTDKEYSQNKFEEILHRIFRLEKI